ncbi:hypothetical protein LJC27_03750 [Christensenellaceae bacterium OttesenSCG-928-M15]|nr:hypothetical protein [Christensenellaceae bacterium OttesenSCG-928-M15]
MNDQIKKFPMRVLVVISNPKLAEKARKLFEKNRLPLQYQFRAQGTASSEIMAMLGLGSITKTVSISMMPKPFAEKMLTLLERELEMKKPNTGIAFTTAITGISTPAMKLVDENIRKEFLSNMENDTKQMLLTSEFSLIMAAVNKGFSESVVSAANEAGARGGTIIQARYAVGEEIMSLMGVGLQEEKELVLILSKTETKLAIMKAIGEKFGMRSKAHGVVVSMPIDMIAGLAQEEE